jgi:hypothetical protein
MDFMLCEGVGIDKEVVEINHEEFVEEVSKGIVHVVLEGPRGATKPKGHHCVLEQSVATAESGLPFVSLGHS